LALLVFVLGLFGVALLGANPVLLGLCFIALAAVLS
jgi:hypothetical protein